MFDYLECRRCRDSGCCTIDEEIAGAALHDELTCLLLRRATAWIAVEASCTYDEAVEHLRRRAARCGQPVREVAAAVLDRTLRFDQHPTP